MQALATTKVQIMALEDGPNGSWALHAQEGRRDRKFSGAGSDTDIITSSARAYTSALNKLLTWSARRRDQDESNDNGEGTADGIGDAVPAGKPTVITSGS